MDKYRRKFIIYAFLAALALVAVLLAAVNIAGFAAAAGDADRTTQQLIDGAAAASDARYFKIGFDKDKNLLAEPLNQTELSDEDAVALARKLRGEKNGKTGWVNTVYRYRVYKDKDADTKYVVALEQSEQLKPLTRTLTISLISGAACLVLWLVLLLLVAPRLLKPMEGVDRKQKQFIAEAEKEFKVPLTVIAADAEILELENGASEHTQSIRRQVSKMNQTARQLAALSLFEAKAEKAEYDLSAAAAEAGGHAQALFAKQGKTLTLDIQENVWFTGDEDAARNMLTEIVGNALKFSLTRASLKLRQTEGGYTEISCVNDTELALTGKVRQVFDRFVRLENADGKPGSGLGLSYLRDAVKAMNGRVEAEVNNGEFVIRIKL
ncbi:MAG: HAMP domain-containing histidine kinase [Clostridia bacterium]|nr:HAMP domain-containing histidine kinase [Clostridia bacterium]